jgi:acyl-coenzyme A synthetase/AMP-(fatty) acid ligase/thioesterase domain-containing protein/acyl carrier protein
VTWGPAATIADWLQAGAEKHGDAPAILGIDGTPLTHAALGRQVRTVGDQLRGAGVAPGDVVLIALPDGPDALVAILAAASVAGAFPIAPHEQAQRYIDLLDEVPVRAVIATERVLSQIAPALLARGIMAGRIKSDASGIAGQFALTLEGATRTAHDGPRPRLSDTALLVTTAGTTAAPKIVAASHESVYASITHTAAWLRATREDRSLCIMPLAHLHALLRSTLPLLVSGAEVVATPGFDSNRVLGWIDRFRPTILTAAPSLYRRLNDVARTTGWRADRPSLRLLVTGSDTTDAKTVATASQTFGAPMAEFYGMSEVAPLVGAGEPGDAGIRINPTWAVTIVAPDGQSLPEGQEGEIAVTGGYVNPFVGKHAPAPRKLSDGRYLTGDLGRKENGRLVITGRVDERIHRGGEKIDPRAVEDVLRAHPDVIEAAVFPVPDLELGHRVGAAIVPRGAAPTAEDLQAHAAKHLFAHMVPERIVMATALPASAAGKARRATLAAAFGLAAPAPAETKRASAPLTDPVERRLYEIFCARLNRSEVGRTDRFSKTGGDSFGAVELLMQIEDEFGISIPPATFNANDNIAALARLIAAKPVAEPKLTLVALNAAGRHPPLFIPYGREGHVGFAGAMSEALGPDQPIHAFHAPRGENDPATPERIEEKAAKMIEMIIAAQPTGPYYLAGYSFGSHVAFEIAQQFVARGATVAFLGVIDDSADLMRRRFGIENTPPKTQTTLTTNDWSLHRYVPKPYPGNVVLFRASEPVEVYQSEPDAGWGHLADSVTISDVPGEHEYMMTTAGFTWGAQLSVALARARHAAAAQKPPAKRKLDPIVRHTLAARTAAKSGDRAKEIAEYRKAAAIGTLPLWAQRNLAEALLEDGKVDESIRLSEAANAIDPWPVYHYVRLANLFAQLNRPADVQRIYQQAKAIAAHDTDTQRHFAHICRLTNRLDEAESAIRLAIDLDARSSFAHNYRSDMRAYLSDLLAATRRIPEAIAYAIEAADLDPRSAEKALRVGRLCNAAGRTTDARVWFMKANIVAPGSAEVQTALWGLPRTA